MSTPSGNGSLYTASATFSSGTDIGSAEYVVYKGTGTNTIVNGLSNGTTYYLTIFTREGTDWSSGVEITVTPANVTVFNPGELVIVGFDSQIGGSGATDKIYLATLVDILPNTEFLYVNSRFEAGAAANERTMEWHGGGTDPNADPGIVTITYDGSSSITAGSIISFEINLSTPTNFEINGTTSTDFTSSYNGIVTNISVSAGDQLWLMQGVFTDHGTYNTLNGNVLYGLTIVEDWVDLSSACDGNNSDTQRESRIHPDIECFNLEILGTTTYAYYKNGTAGSPGDPAHDATFRDILVGIMDAGNWNSGSGSANLDITEDFSACDASVTSAAVGRNFCISSYSVDHQWIGDSDTDWFNCANWKGLHIPNEETDVTFNADECDRDIILTTEDTARCKNITFTGTTGTYKFNATGDSDKTIQIFGDLNINKTNSLNFDDIDSGTADGTLILHGDWNNTVGDDGFLQGNSTVILSDVENQEINTSSTSEVFANLKINKITQNVTINDNIEVGNLDLTDGLINTGTNRVYISNTNVNAITNHSTASYINGNLRRAVAATGNYDLPVGDASNYQLANIDINSSTGLTYFDANFNSFSESLNISGLGLEVNGTTLQTLLDAGYWTITPNAGMSGVNYDIGLTMRGATNLGTEAGQHTVVKRANSSSDWILRGQHDNATQSINAGVMYAYRSNIDEFSDFAIAKHNTNILPVELLDFSIKCNGSENKLFWITASELNNDYFEVQRSYDIANWDIIAKIDGAGNSNKLLKYSFTDEKLNQKAYYRLKQVDFDGKFVYSQILASECSNSLGESIKIYPNPTSDNINILIENWNTETINLEIFDMMGRLIYSKNLNLFNYSTKESIDLSHFKSGIYMIRFTDNNTTQNIRIEKK